MTHPASLLKNSWHTYGHNVRSWLLVILPLAALTAAIWIFGALAADGQFFGLDTLPPFAALAIIVIIIIAFVIAARVFTNAAVIAGASANAGHMISMRTAYSRGWHLLWPALSVAVLRGLLVFAGLLLFAVPGIIWASRYSLAVQVVLLEDKRGLAAFRRSRELTSGRLIEVMIDYGVVGLVIGYATWLGLLVVIFAILILGILVNLIPNLNQAAVFYFFQAFSVIAECAALWLIIPFTPLLATAIYRDFSQNR
jgi:hypothetical protein